MPFTIRCRCGRQLTAPDSAAGKRVRCPGCQRTFTLPKAPGAGAGQATPSARSPPVAAAAPPAGAAGLLCPFCQARREGAAVLCVRCGLDFRTGERVAVTEERPRREFPTKNVFLVALQACYRPFRTVEALAGYIQVPRFILFMWLFIVGTIVIDAGVRVRLALAQQERQEEMAAEHRPPADAEPPRRVTVLGLGILFPAMLLAVVVDLLIDTTFYWAAGALFHSGTGFVRLFMCLGFMGSVVRVARLGLLAAILAGLSLETMFLASILFLIWSLVLNVAVLSGYYDLEWTLAIGVGAVALGFKLWVAAALLGWLQRLFGS